MSQCTIQPNCTACTSTVLNAEEGTTCLWNGEKQMCGSFTGDGYTNRDDGYSNTCSATDTACAAFTDCSSCAAGECFWNASKSSCGGTQAAGYSADCAVGSQVCSTYKSSTACPAACEWTDNRCEPKGCGDYTDASSCPASCVWNATTSKCGTQKCAVYANCSDCTANSCFWNTTSMTCGTDPSDISDCTADAANKAQCLKHTDCSSCTTDSCYWNAANKTCGPNATDGSSNCFDARCSPHTDCSSCTTDSCYWNVVDQTCGGNPAKGISSCADNIDDYLSMLQQLQKLEESLYNVLKENAENVTSGNATVLTDDEIASIVDQINKLSEYRMTTYNTIAQNYTSKQGEQKKLSEANAEQLKTLKLLEKGMNESKLKLKAGKEKKLNNMKMIEINTYQAKEYQAHAVIMKDVFIVVTLLVVAAVIARFLPPVGNALYFVIKWGGGIYLAYKVVDVMTRRNDNFDEYTFPVAPTSDAQLLAANSSSGSIVQVTGIDVPEFCAGAYCCGDGTQWSDTQGCVVVG